MRGKLWFLGGAAVGFVIGARAGRERYDQLVRVTRRLLDHPTTQEAAGVVQEQANRLYSKGRDVMSDRLSHTKLGEKFNYERAEAHRPSPAVTPEDTLTGAHKRPPEPTF